MNIHFNLDASVPNFTSLHNIEYGSTAKRQISPDWISFLFLMANSSAAVESQGDVAVPASMLYAHVGDPRLSARASRYWVNIIFLMVHIRCKSASFVVVSGAESFVEPPPHEAGSIADGVQCMAS